MTNFTDRFVEEGQQPLGEVRIWLRSIYLAGIHEANFDKYEAMALQAIRLHRRSSLLEFAKEIRREVADLAKQNTYEGEAKLVYSTTMREVLALLHD